MRCAETMPADRLPDGGIARLVPELNVCDLEASLGFWRDLLGFTVAYTRRESGFVYLEREGAQIMLNVVNGNWRTGPLERPFGRGINLQLDVGAVAPILVRLQDRPWPLFRPLQEAWYRVGCEEIGVRQFLVQDLDGYLLRFVEAIGTRAFTPGETAS